LNNPRVTNRVAELRAGITALETVLMLKEVDIMELSKVIVKADSEYLVKGMTDRVFKWEKIGYMSAKAAPVMNADLFIRLQNLVLELIQLSIKVFFWHVLRGRNQEADTSANLAFEKNG
jgi:ribonuclease HI